ncbi:hypothetical protein BHE74_00054281 [Ensete ventricosum]|nr:hypothetical protein BHE74_00054281 [Ensete ventricosum]
MTTTVVVKETRAVAQQRAKDATVRIVIAAALLGTTITRVARCRPYQDDVVAAVGDGKRCIAGRGCWQRRLRQK